MNEADTCRTLVRPRLESAGLDGGKHFYSELTFFTDGRIVVPAGKPFRTARRRHFAGAAHRGDDAQNQGVVEGEAVSIVALLAPKGRNSIAQGATLGIEQKRSVVALKGRYAPEAASSARRRGRPTAWRNIHREP